jgi:hypothetical protein
MGVEFRAALLVEFAVVKRHQRFLERAIRHVGSIRS